MAVRSSDDRIGRVRRLNISRLGHEHVHVHSLPRPRPLSKVNFVNEPARSRRVKESDDKLLTLKLKFTSRISSDDKYSVSKFGMSSIVRKQ